MLSSFCVAITDDYLKDIDPIENPALVAFLLKYRCSQNIEKRVKLEFELCQYRAESPSSIVWKKLFARTTFIIKDHLVFDRVNNAKRLQNYIQREGLSSVAVPDKCLIREDGTYYLVADYVERDNQDMNKKISLSEIMELVKIVYDAGFMDLKKSNIYRGKDGKFTFIDTENRSFLQGQIKERKLNKYDILCGLQSFTYGKLEPEAEQYLTFELQKLRELNIPHDEGKSIIPLASGLDDADINFDQLRKELSNMNLKKEEKN